MNGLSYAVRDAVPGQPIAFSIAHASRAFMQLYSLDGTVLTFQWLSPGSVLPAITIPQRVIMIRSTPLSKGLTDFGYGGRLLKDSVLGEYTLRQLHWIQEQQEAPRVRCAMQGGVWTPAIDDDEGPEPGGSE